MLVACWSVKGGSGTTVVAAALAARACREGPATIVDFAGDQAAVVGMSPPEGRGLRGWLAEWPAGDDLRRLAVPVTPGLTLLPWEGIDGRRGGSDGDVGFSGPGDGRPPATAAGVSGVGAFAGPGTAAASGRGGVLEALAQLGQAGGGTGTGDRADWWEAAAALGDELRAEGGMAVVDAGTLGTGAASRANPAAAVVAAADVSLLVLRPCFLGLHRALTLPVPADGVVLVDEPSRAMGRREVEAVLGIDVVAHLRWDPRVGRAIDGGTLVQQLPKSLDTGLAAALAPGQSGTSRRRDRGDRWPDRRAGRSSGRGRAA